MTKVQSNGTIGYREATSVLFGPQGTISPSTLLDLRRSLQEIPDLRFLSRTISELPALWPAILESWPELDKIPAQEQLIELAHFFEECTSLALLEHMNTNTLLSPLTVIYQIVEFWKLIRGFNTPSSPTAQFQDVQGFCVGFLTASAVSCSKNETEFQSLASKAVCLALCIGVAVDFDSLSNSDSMIAVAVRWRSDMQAEHLRCAIEKFPDVRNAQLPIYLPDS